MGRMSTWGNPLVVSKSTQLKAWVSPGRQVAFTVSEALDEINFWSFPASFTY